ncbi:hypothetical protein BDV95DRAFT_618910 [Massariosphaeria phaeospora]|uniref:BTB domain-containing protein n=1 Tax=Massariosphaeria phaeospora TaxID=100035 RepID=A0A7C8IAK7_9PLEO|nr:hypothetical protein BDV95DRAFT_618910 [Massariosphaeria phaeospora]
MAGDDQETPTRTKSFTSDSDLKISVSSPKDSKGKICRAIFEVSSEILKKHSEYFAASLRFNKCNGHSQVELEGDNIEAMFIWILYMHSKEEGHTEEWQDKLFYDNSVTRGAHVSTIWYILEAGDKYLFKSSLLQGFSRRWYTKNVNFTKLSVYLVQTLPVPCYMFSHAKGYMEVTKWLAYNSVGGIQENEPPRSNWKHLPLVAPDFVGRIDSTVYCLRLVLQNRIWEIVRYLHQEGRLCDTCTLLAKAVSLHVDPFHLWFPKHSVHDTLNLLRPLTMNSSGSEVRVTTSCGACRIDWVTRIRDAIRITEHYFHGLCIDCMNHSKEEDRTWSKEAWKLAGQRDGRWDTDCTIKHGEPTWYASWMGTEDSRQFHLEELHGKKPVHMGLY